MKYFKFVVSLALLVAALSALAPPASADNAAQIWQAAQTRIRKTGSYTLKYDYSGPRGKYQFDYRVVRRPEIGIRTFIVAGPKAGSTLLYFPSKFGPLVKGSNGTLTQNISLDDSRVADTPIITPVYDMLLEKTRGANNVQLTNGNGTVMGHATNVLTIAGPGGAHTVEIDKATGDVLKWTYKDGTGTHDRTFYDIKLDNNPTIDWK